MTFNSTDNLVARSPGSWPRLVHLCLEGAAGLHGQNKDALHSPTRGSQRCALARQTAIYLAHTLFGLGFTQLQLMFARDRATLRHACAAIEDLRDDARFDFALSQVESALRRQAAASAPEIAMKPTETATREGNSPMLDTNSRIPLAPGKVLAQQMDQVLKALAGEGASGCLRARGEDRVLVVSARKKGISIPVLTVPLAAAEALVGEHLAIWEVPGKSGVARLALTREGLVRSKRLADGNSQASFLAQHKDISQRTVEPGADKVAFDESESPLAWLARRKGRDGRPLLDPVAFAAGERLRMDLTLAQMLPRVTANWSAAGGRASGGGAGMVFSDVIVAARQRITKAMDAIGPEFSGVLVDICGFLKGLEAIESERNWPRRSAKVVVELGLQQLARHYGMAGHAIGPSRAKAIGHWGTDNFRPKIGTYDTAPAL